MGLDDALAKSWTSESFEAFVRDKLLKGDHRSILVALAAKEIRSMRFHDELSAEIKAAEQKRVEEERKRRERWGRRDAVL